MAINMKIELFYNPTCPVCPHAKKLVKKVLKKYHEGRPNSERLYDRARKIIPGGVEHRLAFNYPFPLVSKKVDGCYLWDVDDNRYVDLLMCGGPVILGHNYPPFIEKIMEVLKTKGPCCGITDEYELEAGELIRKHMPSCEQVRFFQSGTEADMAAIRVARVYKSYLANKGKRSPGNDLGYEKLEVQLYS